MIGISGSGADVRFDGVDIYPMDRNRFAEQHHVVDVAGLMTQVALQ